MSYKTYLEHLYFDLKRSGSYSSLNKLYQAVRKEGKYVLGKTKIGKWLKTQVTFGLHRQINRKFRKRKVVVPFRLSMGCRHSRYDLFCQRQPRLSLLSLDNRRVFAFRMDRSFKFNESSRNVHGSLVCPKPSADAQNT
jgi:hypothetical protein